MTGIIKTDKLQSSAGNDAVTIASNGSITTAGITSTTGTFSGNVGIGTSSPSQKLEVNGALALPTTQLLRWNNSGTLAGSLGVDNSNNMLFYNTLYNTERLRITSDGRGLSQFTAKAWVNFNGTGTVAIRDSHNVSSITDNGTGRYTVNFTTAIANANYSVVTSGKGSDNNRYTGLLNDPTTGSCSVFGHYHSDNSYQDMPVMCVQVFGD